MSYEEQIMSKDKYPSIFSPKMEAIVSIILQIFFATRAVLKIGEYYRKIHYLTREFRVKLQNRYREAMSAISVFKCNLTRNSRVR